MKKILVLVVAILAGSAVIANAQSYDRAIGGKISSGLSVTYKQNLSPANNIEASLSLDFLGGLGIGANAFYNWQWQIEAVPGLNWYVGPGASIGAGALTIAPYFIIGIHGNIGIEYKFAEIPLAISLDYGPGFGFGIGSIGFVPGYIGVGGLGVKYTF